MSDSDLTEKYIIRLKALLSGIQSDDDKLSPELMELRHYVLFIHEYLHDHFQYMLTKAVYQVKRPKKIYRFAVKWIHMEPILTQLGYRQTMEACEGMRMITSKEKDRLMKVNTHRNNFGHRISRKDKIDAYKDRHEYQKALEDLYIAVKVQGIVDARFTKRRKKGPRTLTELAMLTRATLESQGKRDVQKQAV